MRRRTLESYFFELITKKRRGPFSSALRFVLWILSWPFQGIVACKNFLFDKGWVRRYSPPVPVVISVGNIVLGGTGKTPVTLMLAEEFYPHSTIAVLSRGYRSAAEKLKAPIMLCKGNGPTQPAQFCGDEPFLIAKNFPKAVVVVGRNRHKASDMAARAGAQLLVLDDGMQHRRLARDFELVVMDTCDLYGQGYFLPRGLLREGISSLSRAHLIILNHVSDAEHFEVIKNNLSKHTKASVIGTRMEVVHIEDFGGEKIESIEGKKVGVFCGIAHPEYFRKTVLQQGAEIVDTISASDHKCLKHQELEEFARSCKEKGAELLLCTEKDRVKMTEIKGLVLPVAWVKSRLVVVEGMQQWQDFVTEVKSQLSIS